MVSKIIDYTVKNAERKSLATTIELEFGVRLSHTEITDPNLPEIIKVRTLRLCPKCLGEKILNHIPCDLCEGKGEVTGVEEEKYRYSLDNNLRKFF